MKQRIKRYLLCLLALVGLLCAFSGAAQADELEVHFLNIGRNDGILIRSGGESAFIDAGIYERGKEATRYMQRIGMTELTYYIGTHAHADHVGGAPVIIEAFRPQAVIQPHDKVRAAIEKNAKTTQEKTALSETAFVTMKAGDVLRIGDAVLECLGPIYVRDVYPGDTAENVNSLVLMLRCGETDILLTADATIESLKEIEQAKVGSLRADVFKNPHHAADTTPEILSLVSPKYTILSTDDSSLPTKKMRVMLHDAGTLVLSTAPSHCGDIILRSDGKNITFDTANPAKSVTLNKESVELYLDKSTTLKATVRPSDRLKLPLFESSDPSVVTVNRDGVVKTHGIGQAVVRVSDGSGLYDECIVTVMPPQLKLKKTAVSVTDGSRISLGWSVEPSSSKQKPVWASEDESIAAVDEKGRITGIYPGQTVVTATMPSGVVSRVTVTVTPVAVRSVSIKPSSLTMTLGEYRSVTASVSPSNATWKDITWKSADESILTVSENGTVYAAGVGKTKLTASAVGGKTKTVSVTVKPVYVKKIIPAQEREELILGAEGHESARLSIRIEPANATIQDVVWSSSNKKIVSVDENGVITAHKKGNVYITCKATDGSGKYVKIRVYVELPTEQIVLNKASAEVYEGTSYSLKASIKPSSSTKKLFWESSDPTIATVSTSGKVTGVRSGTARIRVRDAAGVYAECTVTVKPASITLTKTSLTVKDGSRVSASWRTTPSSAKPLITWTSADEGIAVVDEKGRITGIYPGETLVTATMPSGQVHAICVTVKPIDVTYVGIKPSSLSMTIGESRTVTASVSPSNATWKDVVWTSADESIVTVTSDGLVQSVGVGKTKITAAARNGKSRTVSVTVKPIYVKKLIAPESPKGLVAGVNGRNQVQLTCGIEPANATIKTIAWSSSNKKIATVNANGVVTGLKPGTVTITFKATDGSGRYGRVKVTFAENELKRTVQRVEGEMVAAASRIRYKDNNTVLEIEMTYINRTGARQYAPYRGTLALIAPDGTIIPLMQVNAPKERLDHRDSEKYTYKIPVSLHPRLIGLDLTRCDAVMVNVIP